MNRFYVFSLFMLGFNVLLAQKAFVKADASGANDGSSWADAYTDLQSALDNQAVVEIWVASGIYLPGGNSPDTNAYYSIQRPLAIFGGFSGSETTLDQRDYEQNPTIFSGDLNGDDVPGNFSTNRDDNCRHIMVVDTLLNGKFVLDGVTVANGTNNDFISGAPSDFYYRGAGIYSFGQVDIRNCTFTGNTGYSGVGVFIRNASSAGSVFTNNTFTNNKVLGQATLYMLNSASLTVQGCKFISNETVRGACYPSGCVDVTVKDCIFQNNVNAGGFGGAFFNWHCVNLLLSNCLFEDNLAANGGCIYTDHRDFPLAQQDVDNFRIENCIFRRNQGTDYGGGAIYTWRSSYHAINCQFENNRGTNSGGAIANGGTDKYYLIENCEFVGNEANFGGAANNYSLNTFGQIKGCTFRSNIAGTSGGALICGFKANVQIEDCNFESNNARFGGAIFCQNDSTEVALQQCTFFTNAADNNGGALNIFGGLDVTVDACTFEGNEGNFGGAMAVYRDSLDLGKIDLRNTIFNFNVGNTQGGALNLSDLDTDITSCIFVNNIAGDVGTGGAISTNASEPVQLEVNLTNVTMADNLGALAGGIASWTDGVGTSQLRVQNCAFYNTLSPNFAIEDGNPNTLSNGGNFSNDLTLSTFLTQPSDINGSLADPKFLDALNFDYHLAAGSPLINAGVDAGAPSTDLDGNPRVGRVDIGAYEYQGPASVNAPSESTNLASFRPNPAREQTLLLLDTPETGKLEVRFFDQWGKEVKVVQVIKNNPKATFPLGLNSLAPGNYQVGVFQGHKKIAAKTISKL